MGALVSRRAGMGPDWSLLQFCMYDVHDGMAHTNYSRRVRAPFYEIFFDLKMLLLCLLCCIELSRDDAVLCWLTSQFCLLTVMWRTYMDPCEEGVGAVSHAHAHAHGAHQVWQHKMRG